MRWRELVYEVAVEYLNAYNFVLTSAGENPFAVGIYATGNKERGRSGTLG